MMWMPADSEATCQAVSHAIYHLTRPSVEEPGEVTQYAIGWRQAVDGSWWMSMDLNMVLPIHPGRGTELAQVLAGFVAAGQLSQQSADAIEALAQERTDSTVLLSEVIPTEWSPLMLTDEQAAALWPTE